MMSKEQPTFCAECGENELKGNLDVIKEDSDEVKLVCSVCGHEMTMKKFVPNKFGHDTRHMGRRVKIISYDEFSIATIEIGSMGTYYYAIKTTRTPSDKTLTRSKDGLLHVISIDGERGSMNFFTNEFVFVDEPRVIIKYMLSSGRSFTITRELIDIVQKTTRIDQKTARMIQVLVKRLKEMVK